MKNQSIKAGYKTYDIKFVDHVDEFDSLGGCNFPTKHVSGEMLVKKGIPPEELINTLIHEKLHIICHTYGVGLDKAMEERIVSALANGLTEILLHNKRYAQDLFKLIGDCGNLK